jgi:hypothetical protein
MTMQLLDNYSYTAYAGTHGSLSVSTLRLCLSFEPLPTLMMVKNERLQVKVDRHNRSRASPVAPALTRLFRRSLRRGCPPVPASRP